MKIDRILRSKRKTLALIVRSDGSLEVRAPLRVSLAEIEALVESKTAWIERQRKKLAPAPIRRNGYTNGSRVWLLGQPCVIEFLQTNSRSITAVDRRILIPARFHANAAAALESWFRAEARRVIGQRAEHYAQKYGLKFNGIRISAARTRWGSCGSDNRLNFTYRLVMAPLDVIDYVVVHELVHTVERSHGRPFWDRVAAILPDYRAARGWLRINGRFLDLACEADPDQIQPVATVRRARCLSGKG